jgi:hypothetical protein
MKKLVGIVLLSTLVLVSCDELDGVFNEEDVRDLELAAAQDVGGGQVQLLTPSITSEDSTLEFQASNIDEERITFVYVANEKVLEQKIENEEVYEINISGIEAAYETDYEPKVQFVQYEDNDESEEILLFKQLRYTVED